MENLEKIDRVSLIKQKTFLLVVLNNLKESTSF